MRSLLRLVALVAALFVAAPAGAQSGFKIIVHESNTVAAMDRAALSRLFLKKVTRWESRRVVQCVDLAETSPVRREFSRAVHGREVPSIKSYWQQQVFSGRAVPPAERDSDADIIAYVSTHPDAIGYVSAATPIGAGVRVVEVR